MSNSTADSAHIGVVRSKLAFVGDGQPSTPRNRSLTGLDTLSRPQSQAEQALEVLTRAILSGRLMPGELYSVQGLSAQLGVSRTPVREALIQLVRQGMVKFERNRGVRVVLLSPQVVDEIYEIRLWLEVPSTAEAVRRMTADDRKELRREYAAMVKTAKQADQRAMWRHDRNFHELLLRAAGNSRVVEYIGSLRDLLLIRRHTTVEQSARSPVDVTEAHRPILEAAEAGDAESAARAMRDHLTSTRTLLRRASRDDDVIA